MNEPDYPVTGRYSIQGDKLVLDDNRVNQNEWYPETVNGICVLWRDDGRKIWHDQHKIYEYAVLVKTDSTLAAAGAIRGPSIRCLYDAKMRRRIPGWKDPFVHGPQ